MVKKRERTSADYGRMLVEGLEEFADCLESGKDVCESFNCHKVVLDLQPVSYDKDLVKRTRLILGASQAIFAQFLGVSVKTVSSWEQGTKKPMEIACRFMDEIRRKPDFWRARLRESVRPKVAEA